MPSVAHGRNMAQDRRGSNPRRVSSMRLLAVAATALALLAGWDHLARATKTAPPPPWKVDPPPRYDHRRPSRPESKLVAIYRGRNPRSVSMMTIHRAGAPDSLVEIETVSAEGDGSGVLVLAVRGHDDRTPVDSLGWRVRVAAGAWPGLTQSIVGVDQFQSVSEGWYQLSLSWKDWTPGQPDHCCPLHAGLLVTCFDKAGNESEPSDTLWVNSPGR